jgi:hypothetical protein
MSPARNLFPVDYCSRRGFSRGRFRLMQQIAAKEYSGRRPGDAFLLFVLATLDDTFLFAQNTIQNVLFNGSDAGVLAACVPLLLDSLADSALALLSSFSCSR